MISRAHGRNPDAKIVVAGCYSQRSPEEVLSLPGVSLVIGSKDRANIVSLIANLHEGRLNAVGSLMGEHEFEELVATREGRTRAHLKIQEGCDRYCTYCIIPYARGPLRSRTPENIRKNLLLLAEHGYKEVVMTGIHLMFLRQGYGLEGRPDRRHSADGRHRRDTAHKIRLAGTSAAYRKVCFGAEQQP